MKTNKLFLSITLLLSVSFVFAEGFRTPTQGGESLGKSGGRTIFSSGSNTALDNPARMLDEKTESAAFTVTVVDINVEGNLDIGDRIENAGQIKALPLFTYVNPYKSNSRLAWGLGLYTPYGLSSEWEQTGSFANPFGLRYLVPYASELKTIDIAPVIAYQVTDRLRIFGGVDFVWSQLEVKQFYPALLGTAFPVTEDEGSLMGKGDDFALTFKVGATYQLTDRQFLYASYQHSYDMEYSGDTTLTNSLTPAASSLGITNSSSFASEIKFPSITKVGYGVQVTDRLKCEAQLEYIKFSRFESLPIDLGNNTTLLTALGASTDIAQNWNDTYTYGCSVSYAFDKWTIFGSYQRVETPVPDETFSTTIPDADQNVFAIGAAWHRENYTVSIGYSHVLYDDRTIRNESLPALNGDYQMRTNLYSLTYSYEF